MRMIWLHFRLKNLLTDNTDAFIHHSHIHKPLTSFCAVPQGILRTCGSHEPLRALASGPGRRVGGEKALESVQGTEQRCGFAGKELLSDPRKRRRLG